ncbi:MAG: sugar transferase [Verrucomicrobiota bacterium]|nr:sugar transferase [Verrucomicrobiota bacterium]
MSTETLNYTQATAALPHWWKRPLDLLVIALLLPLWGPVMILVTLWIKLVSPGPIIYRQQRIGFLQRPFTMFKFRSMKVSAETSSHESHFSHLIKSDAPMTKLDAVGDNRLISLGAVLRAAGLDELPQIFNVIRGEMSLVGPRPCTPYELRHYDTDHLARADLPPGLTGYWQVNGKNSTTFKQMIKMDMFYAKNASLRLDLSILAKTIAVLTSQLFGPGPSRSAD